MFDQMRRRRLRAAIAVLGAGADAPVLRGALLSRRALLAASLQALAVLAACTVPLPPSLSSPPVPSPGSAGGAPTPTAAASAEPTPAVTATPARISASCALPPAVQPTPIPYPGYTQEEPSTGLHVTGQAQAVDIAEYRLKITGKVDTPLSLTYDEIRCMPMTPAHVRLECPGFFADELDLAGPTIAAVILPAGPQEGAKSVRMSCLDGYTYTYTLEEVLLPENFLAWQWRREALPPSHGYPLRAVLPSRLGGSWGKWVTLIDLS